jgi:hypothetical protein
MRFTVHALLVAFALMAPHSRAVLLPHADARFALFVNAPLMQAEATLSDLLPQVMPRISLLRTADGGHTGLLGVSGRF